MAAVTHAVSTASTANTTSYASGSFTPAANDLLVVFVTASGTVTNAPTMTDSQGLGFTLVAYGLKNGSADMVYCFVAKALAAASSMTVTFDCTLDAATGAVIQVARVSGMTLVGARAVRQYAVLENQASGTPAPAFSLSCLTGNPTLGLIGNSTNAAGMTAPTSWTEKDDTGYATPTTGAEYVSRDSGFTGTTVTWGSSSASAFGAIILELDTSSAGTGNYSMITATSTSAPSTTANQYNLVNNSENSWNTTEANFETTVPIYGFISNLTFKVTTAPGAGKSRSLVLMLNGAATILKTTINDANTTSVEADKRIFVKPGDRISVLTSPSGTPAASGQTWWAMTLEASIANEFALIGGSTNTISTVERYNSLNGGFNGSWISTASSIYAPVPTAGTISNLYLSSTVAPGAGKTRTIAVMKNGSDTALTAGITDTNTDASDTTHSFTVATGDTVLIHHTASASSATTRMRWSAKWVPDTTGEGIMMEGSSDNASTLSINYGMLKDPDQNYATTETDVQLLVPIAVTAKYFYVYTTAGPGGADFYDIYLRQNGSTTGLGFRYTGASTSQQDTSNTVSLAAGDLINTIIDPTSSGGSPTGFGNNGMGIILLSGGSSNITTTKTITGVSRITATTTKTVTGKGRIQVTTTRTITGVAKINIKTTKTITGVARITASATKTIQGVARITAATTRTETGTARIRVTTTKTITGVSRISITTSRTITGVANIASAGNPPTVALDSPADGYSTSSHIVPLYFTGTDAESDDITYNTQGDTAITFDSAGGSPTYEDFSTGGNVNFVDITNALDTDPFASGDQIQFTGMGSLANGTYYWRVRGKDPSGSNTWGAWSSIRSFTIGNQIGTQTETGVARIQVTTTKTETGVSRIQKTVTKTITGISRITVSTSKTITGIARITAATTRTETGIARITASATKTETGTARIRVTTTKTISGVSRISITTTKTETGISRITSATTRTITGVANIVTNVTTTKTETGVARIQVTTTKTETGTARIQVTVTKTETGVARISATVTKTITGLSRITAATTRTIDGIARVSAATTQNITGVANITFEILQTRTITGTSRIQIQSTQTIDGTARIQHVVPQTETGIARITAATTQTETGTARIQKTATKTITGTANMVIAATKTITGKSRVTAATNRTITGRARIAALISYNPKFIIVDGKIAMQLSRNFYTMIG